MLTEPLSSARETMKMGNTHKKGKIKIPKSETGYCRSLIPYQLTPLLPDQTVGLRGALLSNQVQVGIQGTVICPLVSIIVPQWARPATSQQALSQMGKIKLKSSFLKGSLEEKN